MTEENCEQVRMASMAIADGSASSLSPAQIQAHLASCAECRREVHQTATLTALLDSAKRSTRHEEVWPLIEQQLEGGARSRKPLFDWRAFLVLGFLLTGYRVTLMVSGQQLGFWFKLVPVALVMVVFTYVKENPFKINSELRLERRVTS